LPVFQLPLQGFKLKKKHITINYSIDLWSTLPNLQSIVNNERMTLIRFQTVVALLVCTLLCSDLGIQAASDMPSTSKVLEDAIDIPSMIPSIAPITMDDSPSEMPSAVPSNTEPPLGDIRDVIDGEFDLTFMSLFISLANLQFDIDCPYTVFAPDDAAVEKLFVDFPDAKLYTAIGFQLHLLNILQLHTIEETLLSTDLVDGLELSSASSEVLKVSSPGVTIVFDGKGTQDTNTTVFEADLLAVNGVVHKVDKVLAPNFLYTNIVEALEVDADLYGFFKIVKLIKQTPKVLAALTTPGSKFTLLAPIDGALVNVTKSGSRNSRDLQTGLDTLEKFLLYHTIGDVLPSIMVMGGTLITLQGGTIDVKVNNDGEITFNGVGVSWLDVLASNGIIHGIDGILAPLPPPISQPPARSPRAKPKARAARRM
jgi:uncharacterized surface protein with fasciclin (FAS1) repeats